MTGTPSYLVSVSDMADGTGMGLTYLQAGRRGRRQDVPVLEGMAWTLSVPLPITPAGQKLGSGQGGLGTGAVLRPPKSGSKQGFCCHTGSLGDKQQRSLPGVVLSLTWGGGERADMFE